MVTVSAISAQARANQNCLRNKVSDKASSHVLTKLDLKSLVKNP